MMRRFLHAGLRILGAVAMAAQSQVCSGLSIEDFESYADSIALSSAWPTGLGSAITSQETYFVSQGTNSMRLAYNISGSPLTNTVVRTFGANQDWSAYTSFTFAYGGKSANSTDDILFQLLDGSGGVLGSYRITNGTQTLGFAGNPSGPFVLATVDLGAFTNTVNGTGLKDVRSIVLGIVGGAANGTGTVYFDDLAIHAGQLIGNPGFLDRNGDGTYGDGWTSYGAVTFTNSLPNLTPGHALFTSNAVGTAGGVYYPGITATPGAKYRFSVDGALLGAWSAVTQFGVEFLQGDNTTIVTQQLFQIIPATTSYKTHSMTAVAPAGTSYVRPLITYTNVSAGFDTASFDNARLIVEINSLLSVIGSSVPAGYNSTGWYNGLRDTGNNYLNSYIWYAARTLASRQWNVVNVSIPGDTTGGVSGRFNRDERPLGADAVMIALALGNEGICGASDKAAITNQFFTGITNIIGKVQNIGAKPVIGLNYVRNCYSATDYTYVKAMNLQLNTLPVPSINLLGVLDDGSGHFVTGFVTDGIHPNDAGYYEFALAFVPSLFDALLAGKPTPQWGSRTNVVRIAGGPSQPAPLSFTTGDTVHSFSMSFRVRSTGTGTVASVTLPAGTLHPTIEITPTDLIYVATNGQTISSGILATNGSRHDIVVAHQYARQQTALYVDGVLAGTLTERLAPAGFVLGGPGNASGRPGSPSVASYQDWFVHRAQLNPNEVTAQYQGALQQASLEVYAPLDDASFPQGGNATNRAQSLSTVLINGSSLSTQILPPAPTNLIATPDSIIPQVVLTWTDPGGSQTGYNVERSANNGAWAVIANLPANATTYTDTTPVAGLTYRYRVWYIQNGLGSDFAVSAGVTVASQLQAYLNWISQYYPRQPVVSVDFNDTANTNYAGQFWNTIVSASDLTTVHSLISSNGSQSGYTAQLTGSFDQTRTETLGIGIFPADAERTLFALRDKVPLTGAVTFSGLLTNSTYDFTFLARRGSVVAGFDYSGKYTFTGLTANSIVVNASNNITPTVVLGITPSAAGSVVLTVSSNDAPAATSFPVLNLLQFKTVPSVSRTNVFIDFNGQTAGNWNRLNVATNGTVLANLTNQYGQATGHSLTVTKAFNDSRTGNTMVNGQYPSTAESTLFCNAANAANYTNGAQIALAGLDPAKSYDFTLFASRTAVAGFNYTADYIFQGNGPAQTVRVGASNNTSLAWMPNITPNGSGQITIDINTPTNLAGTAFAVINVLQFSQSPPPAVDLAGQTADPDNDGLTNFQEFLAGTDPSDPDTDNDGMPDGWEVSQGFNPLSSTDAGLDADGDGMSNLKEYFAGTNPNDSASLLKLTSVVRNGSGHYMVTWTSVTGKSYIAQYSDGNPGYNGSFTGIATNTAAGSTMNFTDDFTLTPPPITARYYRIRLNQ